MELRLGVALAVVWPDAAALGNAAERRAGRRVGIFGGTFDPIHGGHLAVASAAAEELDLDAVYFVPAGDPYLRRPPVASIGDRIAMVELAIAGDDRFLLSTVDAERPGPTYSVDTVEDVRTAAGTNAALYLIVGADAALQLARWREPDKLAAATTIVVVGRPDQLPPTDLPAGHPARDATFVNMPQLDVSGTVIRDALANGRPITGMVPPEVERYIHGKGLYSPRSTYREER